MALWRDYRAWFGNEVGVGGIQCDPPAIDPPRAVSESIRGEKLFFLCRGWMAIDQIVLRVGGRSHQQTDETETETQGGGDEEVLHGRLRSRQRLADTTDCADRSGQTR